MRIITLWQPWASWIAWGWKKIETRTHTKFHNLCGEIIGIHAGNKFDNSAIGLASEVNAIDLDRMVKHNETIYPKGQIIATAYVNSFMGLAPNHGYLSMIECKTDRYGLFLTDVKAIEPPIICKGKQGIWNYEIDSKKYL